TGTVNRQEHLTGQSVRIDSAAINGAAAHVDCSDLVKCGRDIWVLRVSRANAPKLAAECASAAADKQVTVGGDIECSPLRRILNTDGRLPRRSAVGGPAKSAEVASSELSPKLVLKAVPHTGGGPIKSEPFLVAAVRTSVW